MLRKFKHGRRYLMANNECGSEVTISKWIGRSLRRNSRIPGFIARFYIPRFLKAIFTIPYQIIFIFYSLPLKFKYIVYRPNLKSIEFIKKLDSKLTLIICRFEESNVYKELGFSTCCLIPFYGSLNLGIKLFFKKLLINAQPTRIFLNSDFGFDEINIILICNHLRIKTTCIQHGLFPASNNFDLDGSFCDSNILHSTLQEKILRDAGYLGYIHVRSDITSCFPKGNLSQWKRKGKPIIFVGPGYIHDALLQNQLIALLKDLAAFNSSSNLIYRPHPRETGNYKLVSAAGYKVDKSHESSLEKEENLVYVGVKSTLLLEAQRSGRIAILIDDSRFPKYFNDGEINFTIKVSDIFEKINELCISENSKLH